MPSVVITRPEDGAEKLCRALEARGVARDQLILSPLLQIERAPLPDLNWPGFAYVFTSHNAVAAAAHLAAGAKAYCVGNSTMQAAKEAGFEAFSADGDANALVQMIIADAPTQPLIHLHGEITRGDVSQRLEAAGLSCRDVVAYRQTPRPLSVQAIQALAAEDPLVVPLFSPRTAHLLAQNGPYRAPIHLIAMSESIAKEALPLHAKTTTTLDQPHFNAMVSAICDRLGGNLAACGP